MNYFVAPRSGEKSYKNFLSTIKNGVPFDRIEPFLSDEGKIKLLQQDVIYAWGNREGTRAHWENMQEGDTVIFYANRKLVSSGEVYFKQHSPNLALAMWPRDEHGNPWEYTFFLKNLKYFSIPMPVFNRIAGFKHNYIIQGFRQLLHEQVLRITTEFGSIEALLKDFGDHESAEIPFSNEPLYVNMKSDFEPEIISNPPVLLPKEQQLGSGFKRVPYKKDYAERNRNNAVTGSKGEVLTLIQEKRRLVRQGREDLARKVERVSLVDDAQGFDVLSFEENGKEKPIEVKTSTTATGNIRFYLTNYEYKASRELENYNLYFIDKINKPKPRITMFSDPFTGAKFKLSPDTYIVEALRM